MVGSARSTYSTGTVRTLGRPRLSRCPYQTPMWSRPPSPGYSIQPAGSGTATPSEGPTRTNSPIWIGLACGLLLTSVVVDGALKAVPSVHTVRGDELDCGIVPDGLPEPDSPTLLGRRRRNEHTRTALYDDELADRERG